MLELISSFSMNANPKALIRCFFEIEMWSLQSRNRRNRWNRRMLVAWYFPDDDWYNTTSFGEKAIRPSEFLLRTSLSRGVSLPRITFLRIFLSRMSLSRVGVPFLRPPFSIAKYITLRNPNARIFEFAIVVERRDLGFSRFILSTPKQLFRVFSPSKLRSMPSYVCYMGLSNCNLILVLQASANAWDVFLQYTVLKILVD